MLNNKGRESPESMAFLSHYRRIVSGLPTSPTAFRAAEAISMPRPVAKVRQEETAESRPKQEPNRASSAAVAVELGHLRKQVGGEVIQSWGTTFDWGME